MWISIFILIFLLGALGNFYLAGYQAKKAVKGFHPDMTRISDGHYHGTFSFLGNVKAEIRFEVVRGKVVNYRFEKLTGTPGYGADYAVGVQIDRAKSLDFEAASGATVTSNFAKAAIRDALEKKSKPE